MSNMDLVEFLTACLDEDEDAAREAVPRRWFSTDNYLDDVNDGTIARFEIKADARHAGRHDPARVLAEVEAKRRILADYRKLASAPGSIGADLTDGARESELENVTRLLALPYADHPDYQLEWGP